MDKQIIWTSEEYTNAKAREEYRELRQEMTDFCECELSDEAWAEAVNVWLEDERCNLNKEVDGYIIAFAELGLWNGRSIGYQLVGSNIKDILNSRYDAEWYGDIYNIRGVERHHDGTNYILYRVAKSKSEAEHIAEKIYNGEVDEARFRRMTRSLYLYVAKVYGWKIHRHKSKNDITEREK